MLRNFPFFSRFRHLWNPASPSSSPASRTPPTPFSPDPPPPVPPKQPKFPSSGGVFSCSWPGILYRFLFTIVRQ